MQNITKERMEIEEKFKAIYDCNSTSFRTLVTYFIKNNLVDKNLTDYSFVSLFIIL
jgi:hypothetical protein